MSYTVHTVGVRGGEGFLIVSGNSSLLVDCGFAWAAPRLVEDVQSILGEENSPAWLVLTHSHYDHCSAAGYVREQMPAVKIAASEHAARVFSRPSAWEAMRELNASAAQEQGLTVFADVPSNLELDRVLVPGDTLQIGDLCFETIEAAGHTKCCIALWEPSQKLLICCESAGVYSGELSSRILPDGSPIPEEILFLVGPQTLVGHNLAFDFIARARALGANAMVSPHYGLIQSQNTVNGFFIAADFFLRYAVRRICDLYQEGLSEEEICDRFRDFFYTGQTAEFQPQKAFDLNASIMVRRVLFDCELLRKR